MVFKLHHVKEVSSLCVCVCVCVRACVCVCVHAHAKGILFFTFLKGKHFTEYSVIKDIIFIHWTD